MHGSSKTRCGTLAGRHRTDRSYFTGIAWGITLAGLGVVFLLAQLDVLDIGRWWRWWPLLNAAWGFSRIVAWTSADDVGSGVAWLLVTGWLLVSSFGWFGLDWSNSWPLVLVAIGAGMVTTSLLRPLFATDKRTSAIASTNQESPNA